MFGIVEGFAVAGAVAAIISACKDGRVLLKNWRSKKKEKRNCGIELDEVDKSLSRTPVEIESAYDGFRKSIGAVYARGDGE
jgi:hypothetical protein